MQIHVCISGFSIKVGGNIIGGGLLNHDIEEGNLIKGVSFSELDAGARA